MHSSVWMLFFFPVPVCLCSLSFSFIFSSFRRMLTVYCLLYALLSVCWSFLCCFSFQFSVSSFVFFQFFECRPCFLVLSVHCWPSYFVFLSLPYLTPPPSSDWAMCGGRGLGGADTSDPSPVIGRWPLSWHSTTDRTPPSTHADVVKMPQIPPRPSLVTTLCWRTPDLVCPRGSLRTTKVVKQGPSANSPVKDLKDLSAMDAFRSRSISVSEHAVRR